MKKHVLLAAALCMTAVMATACGSKHTQTQETTEETTIMTDGIGIFARIVSRLVRILPLFISTLLLMSTLYDTSITLYRTMSNGRVPYYNFSDLIHCILRYKSAKVYPAPTR